MATTALLHTTAATAQNPWAVIDDRRDSAVEPAVGRERERQIARGGRHALPDSDCATESSSFQYARDGATAQDAAVCARDTISILRQLYGIARGCKPDAG